MIALSPTFGPWIKQRRKELGLTQEDLARRVRCSRMTILKIELGERRPSGQVAGLLAEALGVLPGERKAFTSFARSESPASNSSARGQVDGHAPWRALHPQSSLIHGNLPAPPTAFIGR